MPRSIRKQEKKDWKKFEHLVAKVQSQFSNGSIIAIDQKLPGKAGAPRQIDILITGNVAQFKHRIAIECKDTCRPIDIKAVEQTIGLFDDVGISQGIIVSASGFTKAALTRCKQNNISAYRLVDTNDHKWKVQVKVTAIFTIRRPVFRFKISSIGLAIPTIDDVSLFQVFSNDGIFLGTGEDILRVNFRHLQSDFEALEQDEHLEFEIFNSKNHYILYNGIKYVIDATAYAFISKDHFYGNYPMSKFSGFADMHEESIMSKEFELHLNTDFLNEVISSWESLPENLVYGENAKSSTMRMELSLSL